MFEVKTIDTSVVDASRDKSVPVHITYPANATRSPVIIFSHGAGGARMQYAYLAMQWAAHGYVCLQPSHGDSIQYNRELHKKFSFISELKRMPTDEEGWRNRVADITTMIDSLQTLQSENIPLAGKFDSEKIGVAGHSYGAFTTTLIAGGYLPLGKDTPRVSVADSRVKAFIGISPQGLRTELKKFGFDDDESFSQIEKPFLFLTADRDESGWSTTSQRLEAFELVPPGDKYLVVINGANHMTFVGETEATGPKRFGQPLWERGLNRIQPAYGDEADHLRRIEEVTTYFWDAYLKGDQAKRQALVERGFTAIVGSAGAASKR